jgi:hypothetical protein
VRGDALPLPRGYLVKGGIGWKITKHSLMWGFNMWGRWMVSRIPYDEFPEYFHESKEPGDSIIIELPTYSGKVIRYNLTRLTEEELNQFEKLMKLAIDQARPITQLRDEYVKNLQLEDEEDLPDRRYRPVPGIFTHDGPVK